MSQFPETETWLRQKPILKYDYKDITKEMQRMWNGKNQSDKQLQQEQMETS